LRRLREALLLLVAIEDGAAILVAVIAELRIGRDRIDVVPEHVEQLGVTDLARVVCQLDGFGMPGRAGRHLLVRGVRFGATGISAVTETTPSSLSNGASMHQKQPPANVAVASCGCEPPPVCAMAGPEIAARVAAAAR